MENDQRRALSIIAYVEHEAHFCMSLAFKVGSTWYFQIDTSQPLFVTFTVVSPSILPNDVDISNGCVLLRGLDFMHQHGI